MTYKEFLDEIKSGVQKKMDTGEVMIIQVDKNNGIRLDGLIIKDGRKNISPTIYMEQYFEQYQQGISMPELIEEIYDVYHKYSDVVELDRNDFACYERIMGRIAYKLINFEKNQELLKKIPYVRYLDLAIVFYVVVNHSQRQYFENASFLVRDEHLKLWNTDIGDVYRDALYNTPELFPAELCSMREILTEAIDQKMDLKETEASIDAPEELYILTNVKKINGAACMLYQNVLKNFAEKMKTNLYILPSSVHEVLLIPDRKEFGPNQLRNMVRDVNDTELSTEEILSYQIYYYDLHTNMVTQKEE